MSFVLLFFFFYFFFFIGAFSTDAPSSFSSPVLLSLKFFLFRCSCIVLSTGSYNSFPFTTGISFLTSPRHFLYYQKSFSLAVLSYCFSFIDQDFFLFFSLRLYSAEIFFFNSLHHRSFITLESLFDLITFLFCFIRNLFSFYRLFISFFLFFIKFFLLSIVTRTSLRISRGTKVLEIFLNPNSITVKRIPRERYY